MNGDSNNYRKLQIWGCIFKMTYIRTNVDVCFVTGLIRDFTGSYFEVIILAASLAVVATVLFVVGHFCRQRNKRKTVTKEDNLISVRF